MSNTEAIEFLHKLKVFFAEVHHDLDMQTQYEVELQIDEIITLIESHSDRG